MSKLGAILPIRLRERKDACSAQPQIGLPLGGASARTEIQ
jgi:hypothetical protein